MRPHWCSYPNANPSNQDARRLPDGPVSLIGSRGRGPIILLGAQGSVRV